MKTKLGVGILLLFLLFVNVEAAQYMGGRGLFYTQSPVLNEPGQLSFKFYARGYIKNIDEDAIRHGASALSADFVFSRRVEFGMTQIVGQSVHLGSDPGNVGATMIPGNTMIRLRLGNFSFNMGSKPLFFGFNVSANYRTGNQYNVYLEPYQHFAISGRVDALFSYYWRPFYIEESSAIHFNVGYVNFNDGDESVFESAQAIPVALAFCKSNLRTEYSLEVYGDFFARHPMPEAYSREDYLYVSPGFKYKLYMGFSIGIAVDILAYAEEEMSIYNLDLIDYPQYPEWRLNLKLDFTPSTAFYHIPTFKKPGEVKFVQSLGARRVIVDRKSLFEWVVDENQGAQYIDLELEKIREERKRAEEELEKLKAEIEEISKGK